MAEQAIPQTPAVQDAVPFALLQTVAQVLQWDGSAFRLISQPFEGRPSQSAYPALQVEMTQAPAVQPDVAFARLQTLPQVPQLLAVVLVLVSQPLVALPSQLPYGAVQVMPQMPLPQSGAPLVLLQTVPQTPQFAASVLMLVSQPLTMLLSQFP